MEKQLTVVEWLIIQFSKYCDDSQVPFKVIEQAQEMYKEQLIEFADEYEYECTSYKGRTMSPEEFYSYIFKSE
jgi:hypothetical protein